MYQFNSIVKKIVHDSQRYYLSVINQENNQIYYQNINESAFTILKLIAEYNDLDNIIKKMSFLYKKDKNIEEKVVSFVKKNIEMNVITEADFITYVPKVIEVPDIIIPKYCILEITSCCLLNCSHCYLGEKKTTYIEKNYVLKIIDELSKNGCDYIQLTGGEPLLYPYIKEIIDAINRNGIRLAITTSGYLDNDYLSIFQILKSFRKDCFLQVSIDGFEETHNKIRGKKDAFNKSVEFIKKAIANEIEVQIAYVVQAKNIDDVEIIIQYFKSIGVSRIRFTTLMEAGFGRKEDVVNNQAVNEMVNHYSELYKTSTFDVLTSEDSVEVITKRITPNCGCGSEMITIDSELNLLNCVLYRKKGISIKNKSLVEILKLCSKNNFAIKAPNDNDCKGCEKINYCKGCITLGRIEHDKKPC